MTVLDRNNNGAPRDEVANVLNLYQTGHRAAALARAEALLALYPDDVTLLTLSGVAYAALRQFETAAAAFSRAAEIRPGNPAVHVQLGNALGQLQRWDAAATNYRQAISLKPDAAEAYAHLGWALIEMHDYAAAADAYRVAVEKRPDYAEAYNNLGYALIKLNALDEAETMCRRAVALRSEYPNPWNGLATIMGKRGNNEEAVRIYRHVLAKWPDYHEGRLNFGIALSTVGAFDESRQVLGQVLAVSPENPEALFSLSLLDLGEGDFDHGWPLYEWRGRRPQLTIVRSFPQPIWLGDADIAGKAILLHHEQGLGDTIQFMRYALRVRDLGARVTLFVQEPLHPLIEHAMPGVTVISSLDEAEPFDFHTPLLSLPLAFRTCVDSVPVPIPYLFADPLRIDAWRKRLPRGDLTIGICWRGSEDGATRGRSLPLAQFAGIAALPGVQLISLQKNADPEEPTTRSDSVRIATLGADFDPPGAAFLDTAAIMALCDLVITVDTSIAHLAGALGVETWVVLPYVADWRWLRERGDTPWYPTLRLFRQSVQGQWDEPFAEISRMLGERMGR